MTIALGPVQAVTPSKTPCEIKRCLKRYLARRIYRLLEADPSLTAIPANSAT